MRKAEQLHCRENLKNKLKKSVPNMILAIISVSNIVRWKLIKRRNWKNAIKINDKDETKGYTYTYTPCE